jgi:hypothetical protein
LVLVPDGENIVEQLKKFKMKTGKRWSDWVYWTFERNEKESKTDQIRGRRGRERNRRCCEVKKKNLKLAFMGMKMWKLRRKKEKRIEQKNRRFY